MSWRRVLGFPNLEPIAYYFVVPFGLRISLICNTRESMRAISTPSYVDNPGSTCHMCLSDFIALVERRHTTSNAAIHSAVLLLRPFGYYYRVIPYYL